MAVMRTFVRAKESSMRIRHADRDTDLRRFVADTGMSPSEWLDRWLSGEFADMPIATVLYHRAALLVDEPTRKAA